MVNFYTKASKNIFNIKTLISYLVKNCFASIYLKFHTRLFISYIFLFVLSFLPVLAAAQTLTFSSNNPAVPTATLALGSTNQIIYQGSFVENVNWGVNIMNFSFTPSGTFVLSDISNYKFWTNTSNNFSSATSSYPNATPLVSGATISTAVNSPWFSVGQTCYFWITADINASAKVGHTLYVGALTSSSLTFNPVVATSGTMYDGATQSLGAVLKQFISKNSGDWTLKSTWLQSTDGGTTWVAATSTPTSSDGLVTIRSGHTVALTGATTASDLLVNGNLDLNTYALTGTGGMTVSPIGTLIVGGATNFPTGFTSTNLNAGSTVNYDMAGAQTVSGLTYSNLIFSGAGAKTMQAGTTSVTGNLTLSGTAVTTTVANLTIGGNLNIGDGTTFNAAGYNMTVMGTTTVGGGTSGTLNFISNVGTKIFTGLVTNSANAIWNNSANENITFRGGVISYGGGNAGTGTYTFDTNNQTFAGIMLITNIAVNGITLTNKGALTVSGALSGTGTFTQDLNAVLYIGGTSGITTLNATNTGNTVYYNASANQTIKTTNYYNLSLTGTGTKTISTSFFVNGNLSISGSIAQLNSGVNVLANSLSLNGTAQANGTYGSSTSSATTKNNTYFASTGIVTVNAACAYASNTLKGTAFTPVINMASNPQTVSSTFTSNQYFVLNVIKGLTYQVYTNNSPGSALKMSVYEEGNPTGSLLASSLSNTGNPVNGNVNNVYLSFTSPLSGQVRVLINLQSDCSSTSITGLNVNVNVSGGNNTQDSQTAAGTDKWTGQVYDSPSGTFLFENYLGYYDVGAESFSESFGTGSSWPGDDVTSFNVYSNGAVRATEEDVSFNVRYLMNSTRRGFYSANMVSDDGAKLIVDGTVVYNHWDPHSPTTNNTVLLSLTGSSLLTLEYFEQAGQNGISFNMAVILLNQLSSNISQTLCKGTAGSAISGDVFPALLTGMYNSGYQWYYSTPSDPTRKIITGATGPTFTPNASAAPFNNLSGIYYIYRVAKLSTTNNYNPNPYDATNESNAATVRIKDCTNYWIGGPASTAWNTVINWTDGIPLPGDDIEFASSSNSGNAGADPFNDLVLDNYYTVGNFKNQSGKQLIVPPATGLVVNSIITTDGNPGRIYIKSSQSAPALPGGSLIFHNDPVTQPVNATVEMYSKAKKAAVAPPIVDGAQDWYSWQYFGIPLTTVNANPTFYGSYLQQQFENGDYDHKWGALNNSSILQPFTGYAITQDNPITIVFSGQLVNSNLTSYMLPYTSGAYFAGQSLLANPYTAAIDINQLVFGANTQQTVYLYNTGSYGEWYNNAGSSGNSNGQYLAIPKNATPVGSLPNDIPSMSGFMVNATAVGGSITINYSSVINNVNPQRAPSASKSSSSDKTYIEIALNGEHTSDRMWLIDQPGTTHGFDNGWDGYKYSGALGTPMLFAMEDSGNYQVSTSDDLNNTYLGFQAGVDLEDTLTFKHENIELKYDGLYLVDLVENKVVDISKSGTQYSFKAESTVSPVKRFKIVTEPYVKGAADQTTQLKVFNDNETVFVDNPGNEKGELYFYDIMGRYLKKEVFGANSISSFSVFSKSGAYVVRAITSSEKVSKRIIVNYQGE